MLDVMLPISLFTLYYGKCVIVRISKKGETNHIFLSKYLMILLNINLEANKNCFLEKKRKITLLFSAVFLLGISTVDSWL